MKKIETDEVCIDCHGTGLYIGVAERDGSAIICSKCHGTGCFHFVHEYEDFVTRSYKVGVKRVFQVNPGIVIGESPAYGVSLEDFGGMPISDWLSGKQFEPGTENRKYTCPQWWYQLANYKKQLNREECFSSLGSTFSSCKCFSEKEECWKMWDGIKWTK